MSIPFLRPLILRCLILSLVLAGLACHARRPATTSGFLTVEDDSLYYEASGDGFPLVLVSGGSGMDLRQWEQVAVRLSREFRVVRYDPRGIGKSANPTTSYSDASDLQQLLDHLGLDRVGVVGLSSAGGLVLEFALRYPERVAGVVAAAPFVPGFQFSDPMKARLARFNQAAQQGREPFLDRMFEDPHFIPAPLDGSVRARARQIMAENFDKGAGVNPNLAIPLDPPLIEQLSRIEPPVLMLVGELDHPEILRRTRFLAGEIREASERIVPQSGHNTPLENPAGFLDAASPFLHGLARRTGVQAQEP